MTTDVQIGNSLIYSLKEALLIYRGTATRSGGKRAFVTRHPVETDNAGLPGIGPAGLLSQDFVRDLVRELEGTVALEVLPANVLARTPETLCWWSPAATRVMFYRAEQSPELARLSGQRCPQPALLFLLRSGQLSLRALAQSKRPTSETELFRAPYWNVSDSGSVCLGSTQVPDSTALDSINRWEKSFFESEFTHPNGTRRLVDHPKGFAGLWTELKDQARFPARYLATAEETLTQFLRI